MTRFAIGSWLVAVIALLTSVGTTSADEKPTIDDVKKAWKARQDANKSFRIEWTETVKIKAGAYDYARILGVEPCNPGPHPPEDHEYTAAYSFASDGDKAAGSDERSIYFLAKKTWVPYMQAIHFDGKTSMMFTPSYIPGWARVNISKDNDPTGSGLQSTKNHTIRQIYRGIGGPAFSEFAFDKFKLTDGTETIRGAECVQIALKDAPKNDAIPDYSYTLWCDPGRDFLPVRERYRYKGGGHDLDYEYRKDDQERWVPAGWNYTSLGLEGAFAYTVKAEVKKLELNHKFAADAFNTKPPPSSHVSVYEDGEQKEEYLVRPDGSKRPLKPSERDKDFNELIKTNADGTPYVPPKK